MRSGFGRTSRNRHRPTDLSRRIARYLAEHGPVHGADATEALGLKPRHWWAAVEKCPWFTFDGPGPSGWTLTELGRAEGLS